jgi:hypothetical protein
MPEMFSQHPVRPLSMPKQGMRAAASPPTLSREVVDPTAEAYIAMGGVGLGPACAPTRPRCPVHARHLRLYWRGAATRANC